MIAFEFEVTVFISSDLFLVLYQGCFFFSPLNVFGGFNTDFIKQEFDTRQVCFC